LGRVIEICTPGLTCTFAFCDVLKLPRNDYVLSALGGAIMNPRDGNFPEPLGNEGRIWKEGNPSRWILMMSRLSTLLRSEAGPVKLLFEFSSAGSKPGAPRAEKDASKADMAGPPRPAKHQ
jgi:hypothetical protein